MKIIIYALCLSLISCTTTKQVHNPRLAIADLAHYISVLEPVGEEAPVYYLHIFIRLPSTIHPSRVWTIVKGTGHVFIGVQKIEGEHTTTHYFGFYPKNPQTNIFSFRRVPGELCDNRFHSYDFHFRTGLNQQQLKALLAAIQLNSSGCSFNTYQNNCVHFALLLINTVVPKISIETSHLPHRLLPKSCITPGDLFQVLLKSQYFEYVA